MDLQKDISVEFIEFEQLTDAEGQLDQIPEQVPESEAAYKYLLYRSVTVVNLFR